MKAKARDKKEPNTGEYKIPLRMSSRIKPFALALLLGFVLTATLLLACLPLPALANGTPITTCQELQNMKNDLTADYYLANDIDCSGFDCGDEGEGFMPIGWSSKFTGKFDGKGYKITLFLYNERTLYK
ncbi:MAG: hypothetical protein J7K81_05605 [Methanophagales archaeon]|nr:hypothetical protein [Methanophagales archaeon]